MSEIYIFSQDDVLITTLTESTGLISAPFRDELNSVASEPFVFIVDADVERSKFVKEENRVVFQDKDGYFREMVIKELDDIDNTDGPQTSATCLPAWLDELSENFVLDKRYTDKEAQLALNDALSGTRYIGEVRAIMGVGSTNFYRLSSADCIWKILDVWGGEFKDTVEFVGNKITVRKIIIDQRLGVDRGARFEIDHNIDEIQRTILSYPKTAMYGWGASLEITDEDGNATGGHTRYIDFGDVEWKVSKGDPVDKPLGQKWVGDPDALLMYGRKHNGELKHRFGEFSNQDYEDPKELLWATWNALQVAKKPEVNYRLKVDQLDKDASLGDTARAIDRQFARPIEIQTRVIAIEYDLLDIDGTAVVEMGQFLSLDDDRLDRLIDDVEGLKGRQREPVTDDSFPDIVPKIPTNFKAEANFKTIMLSWDYDATSFIAAYEIYGSQVQGFIPDSQHLLWRGKAGGCGHAAETDQRWYYRMRAINTRGTASGFTNEISADTQRILTPDILFGEDFAAELRELSKVAQLLADGSIDGDLEMVDGLLQIRALAVGAAAIAYGAIERFHLQEGIIGFAQIEKAVITDELISPLAKIDFAKIVNVEIVNAMIRGQLDAAKIKVGAGTSFESGYDPTKMIIGGANLIPHTTFTHTTGWATWGSRGRISASSIRRELLLNLVDTPLNDRDAFGVYGSSAGLYGFRVIGGREYTVSFYVRVNRITSFDYMYLIHDDGGANMLIPSLILSRFPVVNLEGYNYYKVQFTFVADRSDNNARLLIGTRAEGAMNGTTVYPYFYIKELKLEEGNRATGWAPKEQDVRDDLRLTAPLPTALQMDSSGITASTPTSDKYARLDHRGLFINKGAVQIQRDDGALFVVDGKPQFALAVQAKPFYNMADVSFDGMNYVTTATTMKTLEIIYISHDGRYLSINTGASLRYDSSAASISCAYQIREFGGNSGIVASGTVTVYRDRETEFSTIRIDLGVPTYGARNFYLEVRRASGTASSWLQFRTLRMWQSG
ncbi:phage tail protein [Bacillus sp. FJAT-49732]|uniref:Phage tail protein n=1 Tax=Lederbergia citrisecunda TaxID=2833583 RepID=A0A942TLX3_9BACI|nr:phage tail spike protein [Lederbergia citrisecunda]MBS4198624.1 phage tail protein [Lederbergia citrisecunda]